LGLKPWEFDRLTPGEFSDMLNGYKEKVEAEKFRCAWMVANLVNVHLDKSNKVSIDDLLGKKDQLAEKKPEQKKRELIELRRRFGEW
jgi:hypothetical protein